MKKIILYLISELQLLGLIESNFKVLANGVYYQVENLTTDTISKSFIFYEKIHI